MDNKIVHDGMTLTELMYHRRWCYYVPEGQCDEHGYTPSVIIENVPGHFPLRGDPKKHQAPWYWGLTLATARTACENANLGLKVSPKEALKILSSSLFAKAS